MNYNLSEVIKPIVKGSIATVTKTAIVSFVNCGAEEENIEFITHSKFEAGSPEFFENLDLYIKQEIYSKFDEYSDSELLEGVGAEYIVAWKEQTDNGEPILNYWAVSVVTDSLKSTIQDAKEEGVTLSVHQALCFVINDSFSPMTRCSQPVLEITIKDI